MLVIVKDRTELERDACKCWVCLSTRNDTVIFGQKDRETRTSKVCSAVVSPKEKRPGTH